MRPMINQIEAHGYFMDEETVAYCREKGIALHAWRPLMRTGNMLENVDIQKLGRNMENLRRRLRCATDSARFHGDPKIRAPRAHA